MWNVVAVLKPSCLTGLVGKRNQIPICIVGVLNCVSIRIDDLGDSSFGITNKLNALSAGMRDCVVGDGQHITVGIFNACQAKILIVGVPCSIFGREDKISRVVATDSKSKESDAKRTVAPLS